MALAIVHVLCKDYAPSPWHQWICYTAVLWLAVAVNVFATRLLPACNRFIRAYLLLRMQGRMTEFSSSILLALYIGGYDHHTVDKWCWEISDDNVGLHRQHNLESNLWQELPDDAMFVEQHVWLHGHRCWGAPG